MENYYGYTGHRNFVNLMANDESQLHKTGKLAKLRQLLNSRVLVAPILNLFVITVLSSHVHLPWPTDAIGVFVHHLAPVSHPSY
jgi:hypothetical protein